MARLTSTVEVAREERRAAVADALEAEKEVDKLRTYKHSFLCYHAFLTSEYGLVACHR